MAPRFTKQKSYVVQTFIGTVRIDSSSLRAGDLTKLREVATSAIEMGREAERPIVVDDSGRKVDDLPPYGEMFTLLNLSEVFEGAAPTVRRQVERVTRIALAVSALEEALTPAEARRGDSVRSIKHPVLRTIAHRDLKAALARLAAFLDPSGETARAIEALQLDHTGFDSGDASDPRP